MSNWISVKDRLPEINDESISSDNILITDGHIIFMGTYSEGSKPGFDSSCLLHTFYHLYEITHWMPLPELPEKRKEKRYD